MLVSKNAKICVTPKANAKICVTSNPNPQRKQVEYRSCWVPNANISHWPCTFLFFFYFILIRSLFLVKYELKLSNSLNVNCVLQKPTLSCKALNFTIIGKYKPLLLSVNGAIFRSLRLGGGNQRPYIIETMHSYTLPM